MAKAVSPSAKQITVGQVSKLFDLISAGLLKAGLPSEHSQQVIERQGESLVADFVEDFRQRVGAIRDPITRRVKVNCTRTPQEALDATNRRQITDSDIVQTMPRGEVEEVEVVFFFVGYFPGHGGLEKEYRFNGLRAVDPISLAAVNEADPKFASKYPNGTHWKNAEGNWCHALFHQVEKERILNVVESRGVLCFDGFWFGGVPK